MRVFVDGSIVEVFTSAGRSVTTRVYPTHAPPWTLEAPEGVMVWELAAVFETGPAPAADADGEVA